MTRRKTINKTIALTEHQLKAIQEAATASGDMFSPFVVAAAMERATLKTALTARQKRRLYERIEAALERLDECD